MRGLRGERGAAGEQQADPERCARGRAQASLRNVRSARECGHGGPPLPAFWPEVAGPEKLDLAQAPAGGVAYC